MTDHRNTRPVHSAQLVVLVLALQWYTSACAFAQHSLGTYGRITEFRAGRKAQMFVTGDFNGDRITDLAAAGNGTLYLHYQDASGAFHPSSLSIGKEILGLVAARCNNDRFTDLIVFTDNPPEFRVYIGRPREHFTLASTRSLAQPARSWCVGDVNNDGRTDLLLFGEKELGAQLFLGNANGSFQPPVTLFQEYSFSAMTVTSINDDGINDVIATNWISNQLLLFSGFGRLKFSEPVVLSFDHEPAYVATAMLDRDANLDLVVAFRDAPEVQTLLGNGLGDFHVGTTFQVASPVTSLDVADVNNDGLPDLGIFSAPGRNIIIALNGNDGHFEQRVTLAAGKSPASSSFIQSGRTSVQNVAILDTSEGSFGIFWNARSRVPGMMQQQYATAPGPGRVLACDVDKDGWKDLFVAHSGAPSIGLLMNQRNGMFGGELSFEISINAGDIHLVSKGDTTLDLIATSPKERMLSVAEINTHTLYHRTFDIPLQNRCSFLAATVDSVSRFLILYALEHDDAARQTLVTEFRQIGPQRFVERTIPLPSAETIEDAVMFDRKGDGLLGLTYVTYNQKRKSIEVFETDQDHRREFGAPKLAFSIAAASPSAIHLWCDDVNGDGLPDLILHIDVPQNVLCFSAGRRDSTFSTPYFRLTGVPSIGSRDDLEILDVNHDHRKDLVLHNSLTKSLMLYAGAGGGTFNPATRLASTERLGGFTLCDINNDDLPELILTDTFNGVISITAPESDDR